MIKKLILLLCIIILCGCEDSVQTKSSVRSDDFDYAYNRFRDSGMSENESGQAAKAVTNFVEAQKAQRERELARQRGR